MAKNGTLLWIDDEIELLRAHILFLKGKDYEVDTATNGRDALDRLREQNYDLILLDENMPGLTGLETLNLIKEVRPAIPVVMVTKSEEEDIMNQAIGAKIADYLIKPVNPSQILLTLKKNIHKRDIITETTNTNYQQNMGRIAMQINDASTAEDWAEVYKNLVYWELELEHADNNMSEMLRMQKEEANNLFARFVRMNYETWCNSLLTSPKGEGLRMRATSHHSQGGQEGNTPLLSPHLFRDRIFPLLDKGEKVVLIVFDNFRYDQWRAISSLLRGYYDVNVDDFYCSILPTATQYARNSIFAGLMPLAIDKMMPNKWLNDNEEGGKNQYEEEFLQRQMRTSGKNYRYTFDKLVRPEAGRKLVENIGRIYEADFSVIVYNFLDILSHARTETDIIRELTEDEASFRSLTRSWFEHSDLFTILRLLAERGHTVIITSDHGTIRVDNPVRVTGDRETSANLRYKTGRNLAYNAKEVYEITRPEDIQLPASNLTSSYIFAYNSDFLVYNNDANRYIRYYRNTFQHGGISMEEMLVPFIVLEPKR